MLGAPGTVQGAAVWATEESATRAVPRIPAPPGSVITVEERPRPAAMEPHYVLSATRAGRKLERQHARAHKAQQEAAEAARAAAELASQPPHARAAELKRRLRERLAARRP